MATLTRPSGRTVEYAQSSTGGASDWPVAVVFPPLFQAAAMVLDDNFVAAAASAGLRVVCVSRPGIGETSPVGGCPDASPMQSRSEASGEAHGCLKRWSTSVEACLATHCADVAAVLAELGASCVRIVGICAGTPYALHFYTQHAALVSNVHLTLVVPWVPADCPEHKRLIRLAAQGWLGPHAAIGTLLGVAPAAAGTLFLRGPLDAPSLTKEFTPSERAEFERQCAADDTRAARFVGNLRRHMRAYSLHGVRGDIASSLATQHDLGLPTAGASYSATAGAGLGSVGASRVSIFAADEDKLLSPEAIAWFAGRFAGGDAAVRVTTFDDTSHMGAVQLRAAVWLSAAVKDGNVPSDGEVCWRRGECTRSAEPPLVAPAEEAGMI